VKKCSVKKEKSTQGKREKGKKGKREKGKKFERGTERFERKRKK